MITIWKFELVPVGNIIPVSMPDGAEILTVQTQGSSVYFWARVDSEARPVFRFFEVYGTGHELSPCEKKYIGTFQIQEGALVFHVFERISP